MYQVPIKSPSSLPHREYPTPWSLLGGGRGSNRAGLVRGEGKSAMASSPSFHGLFPSLLGLLHINYFWGSISGMYISGTCPNCQGMGEKQAGNLNLAPKKGRCYSHQDNGIVWLPGAAPCGMVLTLGGLQVLPRGCRWPNGLNLMFWKYGEKQKLPLVLRGVNATKISQGYKYDITDLVIQNLNRV